MAGRRVVIEFLGKDTSLSKTADKVEGRTSKIGGNLKKVGVAAGAGLAIAGVAAVKFGSQALSSASLAQQSMGATETVFGKFADTVIKTSGKAADAVGLSANEYRENANLIGSLFKNQGVAADELAGKTDNMIKVGADLAATFGGTTKESVEALGSAFKGEYDPLERYGISLKESTVNAELAKRGQDKLTGAALAQAKQMAITDLIMRQSKDSVGAFGRESDTLAGAQQRLGAKFENLKATLGEKLLPVATKVTTWFSGFIDQMQSGEGAGGTFRRAMSAIADVLRPIGEWIGRSLVPFIKDLAERFRSASGGTNGLKKSMADLQPTIRLLKAVLGVLWDGLKIAARVIIPLVVKQWQATIKVLGLASRAATWLWNKAFQPTLQFIVRGIGNLLKTWGIMLRALGKVPGFEWATRAGNKLDAAARKAAGLADAIRDIPSKKKVEVNTKFTQTYRNSKGQTVVQHGPVAHGIGFNARGTNNWRGGPTWVGERGPEILNLPRGSQIIPNHKTRGAAGGGDIYINVSGALDPNAVARQIQSLLLKHKRTNGGMALGLA